MTLCQAYRVVFSTTSPEIMLRKVQYFLVLGLSFWCAAYAFAEPADPDRSQNNADDHAIQQAFPSLSKINLKELGYAYWQEVNVYYDPALSVKLDGKNPDKDVYPEDVMLAHRVLRSQLLGKGKGDFFIDCTSGPSGDPGCIFSPVAAPLEKSETIWGLNFVLPGDGTLYVSGHTNNMFSMHKKYEWRKDRFVEIQQPFSYVGLKTTVTRDLKLYNTRDDGQIVVSLPAGAEVTVLINDGNDYLLSTPLGLTGWVKVKDGVQEDVTTIRGIYFAGD